MTLPNENGGRIEFLHYPFHISPQLPQMFLISSMLLLISYQEEHQVVLFPKEPLSIVTYYSLGVLEALFMVIGCLSAPFSQDAI